MAAIAVVAGRHFVFCLNRANTVQSVFVAKAIVGFAFFYQFFGIFFIQIEAFGLHIRTAGTALTPALVPVDSEPFKGIVEIFNVLFAVAGTVGIFNTQNEFAAFRAGKKIIKKGGSHTAYVLHSRRRRGITNLNFHAKHCSIFYALVQGNVFD